MKNADPEVAEPLSPPHRQPWRILRWTGRTQAFVQRVAGLELTMLRIPAGSFRMGSPESEIGHSPDEGPLHPVTLTEFLMARTPITQVQWRTVAQWQPREGESWGRELQLDPSHFLGREARLMDGEPNTDNHPVERVSWVHAVEFCSRLSQRTGLTYTLPSEAQWEYACRAGTTSPFSFGETITTELVNYRGPAPYADAAQGGDRQQTTPVGSLPANPWGLHDMHGNVWEWCLDHWHNNYEGAPADGSAWLNPNAGSDERRLLRGGGWHGIPWLCRSASRDHYLPGFVGGFGFRVVCLPPGRSSSPSSFQAPPLSRPRGSLPF